MMVVPDFATRLPSLTLQPDKTHFYREDFVPQEGWRILRSCCGQRLPEFLYQHSFLLLKPEAIARRLAGTALEFVAERGFDPVGWAQLRLSRNAAHHIWRFQWNAATTDRVELTNLCNAQGNCLLIVLRDRHPDAIPATVKLWRMKGSAKAERRTEAHLRTALRMHNRMLGFVHAPDEPADLVRDLSILFEPDELRTLVCACLEGGTRPLATLLRDCVTWACLSEQSWPMHSVHPEEVMVRIHRQFGLSPVVEAIRNARHMALEDVLHCFGKAGLDPRSWDALTIAAELIHHDRPGTTAMLDARAVSEIYTRWFEAGNALQEEMHHEYHA